MNDHLTCAICGDTIHEYEPRDDWKGYPSHKPCIRIMKNHEERLLAMNDDSQPTGNGLGPNIAIVLGVILAIAIFASLAMYLLSMVGCCAKPTPLDAVERVERHEAMVPVEDDGEEAALDLVNQILDSQ